MNTDNPIGNAGNVGGPGVPTLITTIIGGLSDIGANITKSCSYGHNAASEPPVMPVKGEIITLSIALTQALNSGTCEAQITINGVAQIGGGETILLTSGGTDQYDSLVLAAPMAYNAGDRIGLQTVTVGGGPTGADPTIMVRTRDT